MTKRAILPVLMIAALLTGCGGANAEERIEKQRDDLAAAQEISFTADVTANFENEVFQCTLRCTATPEEVVVEAVEPELIAGVRARMAAGEATLEYEGVILSIGGKAGGPLAAMPILFAALKSGHVIRAWAEQDGELYAAELYAHDDYALTMWFDAENLAPVHASLSEDGAEFLGCEIRDFHYR